MIFLISVAGLDLPWTFHKVFMVYAGDLKCKGIKDKLYEPSKCCLTAAVLAYIFERILRDTG